MTKEPSDGGYELQYYKFVTKWWPGRWSAWSAVKHRAIGLHMSHMLLVLL